MEMGGPRDGRPDPDRTDARKRALIADDDEFFRLAISALLLRHCGFSDVVETSSLDEALAELGAESGAGFALALFDLEMPGMAGAASLSAVRECHPDVLVAVVTASTSRQDVLRSLEVGVHGYVSKKCGVGELKEAVMAVLAGQIVVPAWIALTSRAGTASLLAPLASGTNGSAAPETILADLTPRQADVLRLVVEGKSNKEIGRALSLAEGTIKIHVAALLRAFKAPTRAGVASLAASLFRP